MIAPKQLLALTFLLALAYGLQLKQQYHQMTHPYIHDVQKVCQCPPEYPYDNGKECEKCDMPAYWNFTALKCEICPLKSFYDFVSQKCVACSDNNPFWNGSICTKCPIQTPVWNGKYCDYCPLGQYWDLTTEKCMACPTGQVYDSLKNLCICPV